MKIEKGFTLVEVVISMTIIAIVMYALISVFITAGVKGVSVEVFTVAQSLAEGKLEEIMVADFEDITDEAQTNYSGDLNDFSYEVVMAYVSSEALDTAVGYTTNYKKIKIQIRHPELSSPTELQSIRTNY